MKNIAVNAKLIGKVTKPSNVNGYLDFYADGYDQWAVDLEKYNKMMENRVLFPSSKNFDIPFGTVEISPKSYKEILEGMGFAESKAKTCCNKPNKYKNIISKNLQFYSCKNCGADLGDIE